MTALEAAHNRPPAPARAPAGRLDEVLRLAQVVADSGMYGAYRGRPEAAATVMLQALELGLSPLRGLTSIHLVEGRPALSAEMMRGLVFAAGHQLRVVEWTDQVCRLAGRRAGAIDETVVGFTMDDARRAGVAGRGPWRQYPQAMLLARATSLLCRTVFPDVLTGIAYTPEELDGPVAADDTGVEVLEVTGDPATGEQLEAIAGLADRLGLDADTLAAGITAVTGGRTGAIDDLNRFDADLVIARMHRRLHQQQEQREEQQLDEDHDDHDEHDDGEQHERHADEQDDVHAEVAA